MRIHNQITSRPSFSLKAAVLTVMLGFLAVNAVAQNPALSLADLLIGLRSKKATLLERNQILAAAVAERGITFTSTPEIEKELAATGADEVLLAAIRTKSQPVKPTATPKPIATPIPTPTPPDFSFYQKRADANLEKGELDAAVTDYDKAVELKNDVADLYVNRGRALFGMKSYDRSVKDFDKAIELKPKTAIAFLNRGASYEKLGDKKKALEDYKTAAGLDDKSTAAAEAKRVQDELDAEAAKAAEAAKPPPAVRPEFLNLGNINTATAVRLVTPQYSQIARQSRIEGKVTVEVELNEEGDIVHAKAISGHAMLRQSAEDAAKRSKFTPATFDGTPIKAKGVITYSFSL